MMEPKLVGFDTITHFTAFLVQSNHTFIRIEVAHTTTPYHFGGLETYCQKSSLNHTR